MEDAPECHERKTVEILVANLGHQSKPTVRAFHVAARAVDSVTILVGRRQIGGLSIVTSTGYESSRTARILDWPPVPLGARI